MAEDVDFKNSNDEVLVASTNTFGTSPTKFALKAKGVVISGELFTQTFIVEEYKKFLTLEIFDKYLTEVISVQDSNGNNYYQVDYLSQDVVYVPILNTSADREFAKNILKPISVPRRFITEHKDLSTVLQFGYGTEDNEEKILDPTKVALNVFGKDYISDISFDPSVLTKTSKLGIAPSDTAINVTYRRNNRTDVNVPMGALTGKVSPLFKFIDKFNLDNAKLSETITSLELINEKGVSGVISEMSTEEIKVRAQGAYALQNRAVTKDDYVNLCYNMPANFGQIKKASLLRDQTSFNGKNLNLYVLAADSTGLYTDVNQIVKQNLRTWINKYKMIGDTIDILDGRVINLQINFSVVGFANLNKYDIIDSCLKALTGYFMTYQYDLGEPFKITNIYKLLNNLPSVVDTKNVEVTLADGAVYSSYQMPLETMFSHDGRYLIPPEDTAFEIKYPSSDIVGEVL